MPEIEKPPETPQMSQVAVEPNMPKVTTAKTTAISKTKEKSILPELAQETEAPILPRKERKEVASKCQKREIQKGFDFHNAETNRKTEKQFKEKTYQ